MESCREHFSRSTGGVSEVSRACVGAVVPWCKCHRLQAVHVLGTEEWGDGWIFRNRSRPFGLR
jgi:hypothetical protein